MRYSRRPFKHQLPCKICPYIQTNPDKQKSNSKSEARHHFIQIEKIFLIPNPQLSHLSVAQELPPGSTASPVFPFIYPKNTPCGYLFNLSSLRCGTGSPPNRTFINLNNRMGTASFCIFKPYITFQRQTSNLQSISCNHTTPISCWGLLLHSTYLPVSFSQKVHYSTISSSAFNSALSTSQKL